MQGKLRLSTQEVFEKLMEQPDVVSKSSTSGPEYITALYRNNELIAERSLIVSSAEYLVKVDS